MHIYNYITIYLPHSSYMFRCTIHLLQGGLLVFLLKTTSACSWYVWGGINETAGNGKLQNIGTYIYHWATSC